MLETGRLCVKTAGRDAMQHCVVVEIIDEKHVLVDGNTRRKKVNILHLEPLSKKFKIKKGADTKTIHELFKEENIEVKKPSEKKEKKEKKPQIKKKDTKKDSSKNKKEESKN
ncbi:MAG: 50S ribosomal protein L14e [Nanoarchaeota archaeon]